MSLMTTGAVLPSLLALAAALHTTGAGVLSTWTGRGLPLTAWYTSSRGLPSRRVSLVRRRSSVCVRLNGVALSRIRLRTSGAVNCGLLAHTRAAAPATKGEA